MIRLRAVSLYPDLEDRGFGLLVAEDPSAAADGGGEIGLLNVLVVTLAEEDLIADQGDAEGGVECVSAAKCSVGVGDIEEEYPHAPIVTDQGRFWKSADDAS